MELGTGGDGEIIKRYPRSRFALGILVASLATFALLQWLPGRREDVAPRTRIRPSPPAKAVAKPEDPGVHVPRPGRPVDDGWDPDKAGAEMLLLFAGTYYLDDRVVDDLRRLGPPAVDRLVVMLEAQQDPTGGAVLSILMLLSKLGIARPGAAASLARWATGKDVGVFYTQILRAIVSVGGKDEGPAVAARYGEQRVRDFLEMKRRDDRHHIHAVLRELGALKVREALPLLSRMASLATPVESDPGDGSLANEDLEIKFRQDLNTISMIALEQIALLDASEATREVRRRIEDPSDGPGHAAAIYAAYKALRAAPCEALAVELQGWATAHLSGRGTALNQERQLALLVLGSVASPDSLTVLAQHRPDPKDRSAYSAWLEALTKSVGRAPGTLGLPLVRQCVQDGILEDEDIDPKGNGRAILIQMLLESGQPEDCALVEEAVRSARPVSILPLLRAVPSGFLKSREPLLRSLADRLAADKVDGFAPLALQVVVDKWSGIARDPTEVVTYCVAHLVPTRLLESPSLALGGVRLAGMTGEDQLVAIGGQFASASPRQQVMLGELVRKLAADEGLAADAVVAFIGMGNIPFDARLAAMLGLLARRDLEMRRPANDALIGMLESPSTPELRLGEVWLLIARQATRDDLAREVARKAIESWRASRGLDGSDPLTKAIRALEAFLSEWAKHASVAEK